MRLHAVIAISAFLTGFSAGQIQEALFCPGETIQLRCPRGHQVVVSYVFYGRRQNQWQCHLYVRHWCTDPDAVHKIRRLCQGKRSCQATADESLLGTKCPPYTSYLIIEYYCFKLM
ncbi:hypothetical protein BOX15_Mlig004957g1 [Macrostomum lignano]|uniref:SUEL-type lectin domain-containing protein n=1 Tax=Macrostomum lignano TaxID=282301 RepID=A0A267H2E3_9PLAT|nr:hypothetical protein BOX15_Mlig004957g1 [Macrostomum lignano]